MAKAGRPLTQLEDLPEGWEEKMVVESTEGASGLMIRERVFNGMSEDLWYRLIRDEPIFSAAVNRCKALCQIWWETRGMHMAMGEDGNAAVWIFNMKNRFNWRDKSDVAHSGEIDTPQMSREEFKQRLLTAIQSKPGEE